MKHTMDTDLIDLEFDVEIGDDPYVTKTEVVIATIEKELSKACREDWDFVEGKIIVEYHDGHAGITNEMKAWVAMLKEQLIGLDVEMRGTGVSACEKFLKSLDGEKWKSIARIKFKCALHWAYDYKSMETMW